MKHFIDYTDKLLKQTFDMAAITDSKGNQVGSIICRYTDSQIRVGWNHNVGVYVCGSTGFNNLPSFKKTYKSHNSAIEDLCYCFELHGFKVYDALDQIIDNPESRSRINEARKIKRGHKCFNILWVV